MKDDDHDLVESLLGHDDDVAVPPDHERRIREGLGALLGGAASATPATEPPSAPREAPSASELAESALRKWITTGVVAVVAAGGGFAVGRSTAPRASPPPVVSAPAPLATTAPAPSTSSGVAPPPSTPSASASVSARPGPVATAQEPGPSSPAADAFDREQSLLERARSALVRHDADAAEKALDEHDRQFPRSRYVEERDYLRIQVLRERGDTAGVRQRAKAFLARYPSSMLRARVEPLAQ